MSNGEERYQIDDVTVVSKTPSGNRSAMKNRYGGDEDVEDPSSRYSEIRREVQDTCTYCCKPLMLFILHNNFNQKGVPFRKVQRVAALLTFASGIIAMAMCSAMWMYMPNKKYGPWWACPFAIIAGMCGIFSINKGYVLFGSLFGFLGTVFLIAGIIIAATIQDELNSLEACASAEYPRGLNYTQALASIDTTAVPSPITLYGSDRFRGPAENKCLFGQFQLLTDCFCISRDFQCFRYSGQSDCDNVLTTYTDYSDNVVGVLLS